MTRRQRTLVLIHVFLAIVIAMAVSYYAFRSDKNDERYAWRMFSKNRMVSCGAGQLFPPRLDPPASRRPAQYQRAPLFLIGEQRRPAQLGRLFHTAWINLTKRGRESIIEAVAVELCKSNPDEPVYVKFDCAHVDGEIVTGSTGGFDICGTGRL